MRPSWRRSYKENEEHDEDNGSELFVILEGLFNRSDPFASHLLRDPFASQGPKIGRVAVAPFSCALPPPVLVLIASNGWNSLTLVLRATVKLNIHGLCPMRRPQRALCLTFPNIRDTRQSCVGAS